MRVDDDRVGALPAGEASPQLRADRGRAGVGGVDVEPDARPLARVGDRRHGIDRARRRRPDRRDDRARAREVERVRPEAERVVDGRRARLEAEEPARLLDRGVRVLGADDDARPGRASRAAASAAIVPVEAVSSRWPCSPGAGRAAARASRASPPPAPAAPATCARGSRPGSARRRAARRGSPAPSRCSRSRRRSAGSASASPPGGAPRRGRAGPPRTARRLRRRGGQPRAQLARLDLGEHRQLAHALEVRRDPVERRGAVLPQKLTCGASRSPSHGRVFRI